MAQRGSQCPRGEACMTVPRTWPAPNQRPSQSLSALDFPAATGWMPTQSWRPCPTPPPPPSASRPCALAARWPSPSSRSVAGQAWGGWGAKGRKGMVGTGAVSSSGAKAAGASARTTVHHCTTAAVSRGLSITPAPASIPPQLTTAFDKTDLGSCSDNSVAVATSCVDGTAPETNPQASWLPCLCDAAAHGCGWVDPQVSARVFPSVPFPKIDILASA